MGRIYFRYIDRQIKDDRLLINNVKSFPVIYDSSDPSYNDRSERRVIWEVIADNLQSTAMKCEERWNSLVKMYKSLNLHDSLYEIMEQFLDISYEYIDNAVFSLSTDGSERIESDTPNKMGLRKLGLRLQLNKTQTGLGFADSFFLSGDPLEVREDLPQSP